MLGVPLACGGPFEKEGQRFSFGVEGLCGTHTPPVLEEARVANEQPGVVVYRLHRASSFPLGCCLHLFWGSSAIIIREVAAQTIESVVVFFVCFLSVVSKVGEVPQYQSFCPS